MIGAVSRTIIPSTKLNAGDLLRRKLVLLMSPYHRRQQQQHASHWQNADKLKVGVDHYLQLPHSWQDVIHCHQTMGRVKQLLIQCYLHPCDNHDVHTASRLFTIICYHHPNCTTIAHTNAKVLIPTGRWRHML